jgi:hypothetical protein
VKTGCFSFAPKQTGLAFVLLFLSLSVHSAGMLLPQQKPILPDPYQPINLQIFINNEKAAYQDKITIVPPLNISFTGVLKTLPKKSSTGYLYTALDLMQVKPIPQVEHQVFIGAPGSTEKPGDVIAIYMDNRLADAILAMKTPILDTRVTWYGYHIYNFSRGPAIVLENVALTPSKLTPNTEN